MAALSTGKHSCSERCSSGIFFPSTVSYTDCKSSSCHPAWWPWFVPLVCVGQTYPGRLNHTRLPCAQEWALCEKEALCAGGRGDDSISGLTSPLCQGTTPPRAPGPRAQLDLDWARSAGPGLARGRGLVNPAALSVAVIRGRGWPTVRSWSPCYLLREHRGDGVT